MLAKRSRLHVPDPSPLAPSLRPLPRATPSPRPQAPAPRSRQVGQSTMHAPPSWNTERIQKLFMRSSSWPTACRAATWAARGDDGVCKRWGRCSACQTALIQWRRMVTVKDPCLNIMRKNVSGMQQAVGCHGRRVPVKGWYLTLQADTTDAQSLGIGLVGLSFLPYGVEG